MPTAVRPRFPRSSLRGAHPIPGIPEQLPRPPNEWARVAALQDAIAEAVSREEREAEREKRRLQARQLDEQLRERAALRGEHAHRKESPSLVYEDWWAKHCPEHKPIPRHVEADFRRRQLHEAQQERHRRQRAEQEEELKQLEVRPWPACERRFPLCPCPSPRFQTVNREAEDHVRELRLNKERSQLAVRMDCDHSLELHASARTEAQRVRDEEELRALENALRAARVEEAERQREIMMHKMKQRRLREGLEEQVRRAIVGRSPTLAPRPPCSLAPFVTGRRKPVCPQLGTLRIQYGLHDACREGAQLEATGTRARVPRLLDSVPLRGTSQRSCRSISQHVTLTAAPITQQAPQTKKSS